jgi:outer membrane protein assembly factor BamB
MVPAVAAGAVCAVTLAWGQEAKPAAAAKPAVPSVLPGKGLAQHDFFYAGEAKTEDMYIVRKGKIAWEYHDPAGKGEISDAVMLSNGSVLFAHQFGIKLIDKNKKTLWSYDAPAGTEIHTAQPIGKDLVLYVQNGDPAKVVVVNIATGKKVREFEVPVRNPKSVHGHFRHARLTDAGTLLVAHMDLNKVVEYDSNGKSLWSYQVDGGLWSAERLKNGNTLVSGGKSVREVNPSGNTVWEFTSADVPDYLFNSIQIAQRLPTGNTIVNTWFNSWNGTADAATAAVQALELTPDKKIVWALHAWGPGVNLGPSTTIQLLDQPSTPEAVHFGDLK